MIDSKQFIITNKPFEKDDWCSLTLINGKILSYHRGLHVCHNPDCSVLLLGHAWSVVSEEELYSPYHFIESASKDISEEDIIKEECHWCGRYIVIANNRIYLDTAGVLGVFYSPEVISSSLHVACTYLCIPMVYPDIKLKENPDFVPGMQTTYPEIKRLLPSQVLHMDTLTYHTRPLLPEGIIKESTDKAQIELLTKHYECSLKNMSKEFYGQKIWLAITGGIDSRTVLAMLEKSGLPYQLFTLEHNHISDGDVIIPAMLAKTLKRTYRFIRRKGVRDNYRYKAYQTNCAGYAVDEDWIFHSYGQYEALLSNEKDHIVMIRSSVWGIPNEFYRRFNPDHYDITKVFSGITKRPELYDNAMKWLEYVKGDNINSGITLWNRTLWELRSGCWLSSIEQSLDIIDNITSVQSCNCRLFLSILFGFDLQDRFSKKHEERITAYLCPSLKGIPYDYQNGYKFSFAFMKRKLKQLIKRATISAKYRVCLLASTMKRYCSKD